MDKDESKIIERKGDAAKRQQAEEILSKIYFGFKNGKYKIDKSNNGVIDIGDILPNKYIVFHRQNDEIGIGSMKTDNDVMQIGVKTIVANNAHTSLHGIINTLRSQIVHEIIHWLTFEKTTPGYRGVPQDPHNDIAGYVNNPDEWEAHFQHTANHFDEIVNEFKWNKDIEGFKSMFPDERAFATEFWNKLLPYIKQNVDKKYKSKYDKRIYQLYHEYLNTIDNTHELHYNEPMSKTESKIVEEVERNPEAYSLVEARSLDYAVVYAISNRFCMPIKKWKAFKLGIIDEKGNILRPLKSDEDRKAFTPLDNVCIRIKRLIPQHLWYLLTFTQIFKGFVTYSTYKSYYESAKSRDDLLKIEEKRLSIMRAKKQLDEIVKNNPNFTEEEFWSHVASAEDVDNG
jgi:hypothetical protein